MLSLGRQILKTKRILSFRCTYYSTSSCEADYSQLKQNDSGPHHFRRSINKKDVIKFLLDNVVYNDDGLVVTSKPYGVGKDRTSKIIENYEPLAGSVDVFLRDVLGDVAGALGHSHLEVSLSADKFSSGVLLLTANEKVDAAVKKSVILSRIQDSYLLSYLLVTIGKPTILKLRQKYVIDFCTKEGYSGAVPVLKTTWSNTAVKNHLLKTVHISHEVLHSSELASLVRVNVTRNKANCWRLHMATNCLSPVLGDSIIGSRVQNILDVPVLIDHWSDVARSPKILSKDLLWKLKLQSNESHLVHVHSHLETLNLPKLFRGKQSMTFSVPPPDAFTWTCKQLGLPV